MQEQESISNGLENFEIEEEKPELFNSENNENESSDNEFTSFENSEEEDDLEIPAFLRRQKN
jgi:cell division protein FtsZ